MRQAGRYLPEYRALRARAGGFVEFCLTPDLAAEATLQPVRRFGMDAAILFADILLIAQALGMQLEFGEDGPALDRLDESAGIGRLSLAGIASLDPVYETVRRVRGGLPDGTALIGFAGAPWTVATYMVEGGASRDFRLTRSWAYRDPRGFAALIDLIAEATIAYLSGQIAAGAEAVQLFDSWAGVLPEREFARWVVDADPADRRRAEGAVSRRAGNRVSARRRAALRALCRGKRRRCGGARHDCAGRFRARSAAAASRRAGQSRPDRAAGRRRGDASGRWPKSAPRSAAARSCSISGTASCRRRRRNTSPRSPGCSPSRSAAARGHEDAG